MWRNVDGRCTHTITGGTRNHTKYQIMTDTSGMDPHILWGPMAPSCVWGEAGISRDDPLQESGQSIQKHTTTGSLWATVHLFFTLSRSKYGRVNVRSILQSRRGCSVVYCQGWGSSPAAGNTATLGPARKRTTLETTFAIGISRASSWSLSHLCHNFQGPAVPHADGLGGVSRNLAVLLRRPQQGRPKHRRQVVERHFVDTFLLCHPEKGNADNC